MSYKQKDGTAFCMVLNPNYLRLGRDEDVYCYSKNVDTINFRTHQFCTLFHMVSDTNKSRNMRDKDNFHYLRNVEYYSLSIINTVTELNTVKFLN